jgi:hypothetical protein
MNRTCAAKSSSRPHLSCRTQSSPIVTVVLPWSCPSAGPGDPNLRSWFACSCHRLLAVPGASPEAIASRVTKRRGPEERRRKLRGPTSGGRVWDGRGIWVVDVAVVRSNPVNERERKRHAWGRTREIWRVGVEGDVSASEGGQGIVRWFSVLQNWMDRMAPMTTIKVR